MPAVSRPGLHVAYRAVLLAAGLVVLGLIFRQIVTLLVAVMITIIWAIPLSALATRLQRHRIPRGVGVLLGLLAVAAVVAVILMLVIPRFVEQVNRLVDAVPGIIEDLRGLLQQSTGASSAEIGQRVQGFLRRYIEQPVRLVGPVVSAGASVAGVLGALVLMLITAYFIAANPRPLVDSALRLFPPHRRTGAARVMGRLRLSWIGWMRGVAFDMLISGTLLYIGLSLIGLEFAIVFAVLSALLVVVPYFGAFAGGLPPFILGLTDSPGRALLVFVVYLAVQQIESNLILPMVMSRQVNLHPAAIAVGVVIVGSTFGFVGLIVAVPIISAIVILTEEAWIRPMEGDDEAAPRGPPMAYP